jgi:hypothetical protein
VCLPADLVLSVNLTAVANRNDFNRQNIIVD